MCGAEIIAQKITSENNTTKASGGVVILEDQNYIRSDNLIRSSDGNETELFGNVYIHDKSGNFSLTDYLIIKNQKNAYSDNLFSYFTDSGLWLSAKEAKVEGNITRVDSGAVSGCEASSPDWSIRFSSAKVDSQKEWLDLYNPVFYAGRVPVFYMPYFGHYTTKKRRSGLLIPSIGQSKKEGYLYGQPIYIAPYDQSDLEITPQIRTDRGSGTTGVFRFVDSPHSKGSIVYGEFKDKDEYIKEYSVAVPKHWGKRFEYSRNRLFTKPSSGSQEGLLFKYEDYSDVEFIDLERVESIANDREISALVTNKADYFYKNSSIYGGIYTREFKNLEDKDKDKTTVQITPELHGHLFSRSLFTKNLIVSIDAKGKNYTRDRGIKATDTTLITPVSYGVSLFDDYLQARVNYQASFYQIDYDDTRYETGKEFTQKAGGSLGTTLAKPYNSVFHTISATVSYLDPFDKKIEGDFHNDFVSKSDNDTPEYPTTSLKFTQHLYNNHGLNFFSHRINQAMLNDSNNTLLDLENEIVIKPTNQIALSNTLKYSHDFDGIKSSSTSLTKSGDFNYGITHLYENENGEGVTKRYLSIKSGYKINGRHSVRGEWQKDLLANENRGWMAGYTYNKKCWKSELSFHKKITPFTTSTGETDSRFTDVIFLKLTLVPFGELNQQLYEKERI